MQVVAKRKQEDMTYKVYISESLRLAPQNKYLDKGLADVLNPPKIDTRQADEIALELIDKLGITFASEKGNENECI